MISSQIKPYAVAREIAPMHEQENEIRRLEGILDSHHEGLRFWKNQPEHLIFGLLMGIDSFLVVETMSRQYLLSVGGAQGAKIFHESFSICLRWLLKRQVTHEILCKSDYALLDSAGELLIHAKDYVIISQSFARYSQGLDEATIGANGMEISFSPKKNMSHLGLREAIDANQSERDELAFEEIYEEARLAFYSVPHYSSNGRIVLDDFSFLQSGIIRRYARAQMRTDPYLQSQTNLDGFTVSEFNRYWIVLAAWSSCATFLYLDYYHRGDEQMGHMPTQVMDRTTFLEIMSASALISPETTRAITDRLSLDWSSKKADIFLQPLISNDHKIAWSPYTILLSRHHRNMLKLMSRTPALKNTADNIIGNREHAFIREMADTMRSFGWTVVTNRILPEGLGEVDLLVASPQSPTHLLLVEAKTLLDVDEPNEVRKAAREIEHGQNQAQRIMGWFHRDAGWKRIFPEFHFLDQPAQVSVVITPRSDPGDDVDQSTIPAIAWSTIKIRLKPDAWESPLKWWQEIRSRRWDTGSPFTTMGTETIMIGKVKFNIPIQEEGGGEKPPDTDKRL